MYAKVCGMVKEGKDVIINTRFSQSMAEELSLVAEKCDRTVSAWIRNVVSREIQNRDNPDDVKRLISISLSATANANIEREAKNRKTPLSVPSFIAQALENKFGGEPTDKKQTK